LKITKNLKIYNKTYDYRWQVVPIEEVAGRGYCGHGIS
jgi:hypothetical protein